MSLTERNRFIEAKVDEYIFSLGLSGKLAMESIPNTFKRRPRFYVDSEGICRFSVFLWQLNKLEDDELTDEIQRRVDTARQHFGLRKEAF